MTKGLSFVSDPKKTENSVRENAVADGPLLQELKTIAKYEKKTLKKTSSTMCEGPRISIYKLIVTAGIALQLVMLISGAMMTNIVFQADDTERNPGGKMFLMYFMGGHNFLTLMCIIEGFDMVIRNWKKGSLASSIDDSQGPVNNMIKSKAFDRQMLLMLFNFVSAFAFVKFDVFGYGSDLTSKVFTETCCASIIYVFFDFWLIVQLK